VVQALGLALDAALQTQALQGPTPPL